MMDRLWRARAPLVLASGSLARRTLLEGAGIPLVVRPAEIDERAVEARLGPEADGTAVALALARAKALEVARTHEGALVLGADQTLALEDRLLHKPDTREAAAHQLLALSGRCHRLASAAVLARDGEILLETVDAATLTMRPLSGAFIEAYLAAVGPDAWRSVGVYQVEAFGIQLFERIEGAHATILGLPLLALLDGLRRLGVLAG